MAFTPGLLKSIILLTERLEFHIIQSATRVASKTSSPASPLEMEWADKGIAAQVNFSDAGTEAPI